MQDCLQAQLSWQQLSVLF